MSILKVNEIQDPSGKIILRNSGSILQVVNANSVGASTEVSTTSATYVTTGYSVSITPISATSKLYVELVGNCKFNHPTEPGDNGVTFKIYRDGVAINTANSGDCLFYRSDASTQNHHAPLALSHYVNANSTATTTFTLFYNNQWGGTGFYSPAWGTHQFTVMEIAA
jgi:hypothetical protein